MNLATKVAGGIGLLIALYLIVTNPKADETLLGSGGKSGVSIIRALQGR